MHGARPRRREPLEDRGDDLGDLVGRLDADASSADGVEGGLLVLDLVQPADVGADLPRGGPGEIASTGTESAYAVASAVIALVMPGPEVVMKTPGRPLTRA